MELKKMREMTAVELNTELAKHEEGIIQLKIPACNRTA